jgi:phospholipid/cholesterol/gamma-HCH transport system ATP-binding protein
MVVVPATVLSEEAGGASPLTTITSEVAAPAEQLRHAIERALASERPSIARVRHAHAAVGFVVGGRRAFTLELDHRPCRISDAARADIEIELTDSQARLAATGELSLTTAVLAGEVPYSGAVRHLAEVEPILRAVLAEQAGNDPHARARGTMAGAGPIHPDLLAIETRNLHKRFGPNLILRGLDIRIPEGCVSVVLGPSGTGKSVLLQHIIGLMRPDEGDVLIRGHALSSLNKDEILDLRRGIGVMFQDGALFTSMNVFDNVAFPLRQHTDFAEDEVRAVVENHLESVGLLFARDRMPPELSGGMRKRAGLARALALNPGIILCDEPDSGLDPIRTALLGDLLVAQHADHGGTMVVVTHNIALAKHIADHISVVFRGKVVVDGLAEDVLAADDAFVRQFLAGESQGPLGMDA